MIVDDERLVLKDTYSLVNKVISNAEIICFQFAKEALSYLKENSVDVALLDIAMPEFNGLQLAKKCKEIQPKMNILFVTGYNEFALDAFQVHPTGYLLKPLRESDLLLELENLRFPITQNENEKGLYVRCFGNFEVFYDGLPMHFKYSKTKELLAYLIDRKGSRVSSGEAIGILWEDRPISLSLKSQWRNCVADLLTTLKAVQKADCLIKSRDFIAVDISKINCDYFHFLSGDIQSINQYQNEYMEQYSWSVFSIQ